MSRLEEKLRSRSAASRKGFIPFVSAGDPDIATSARILDILAEAGADVIELGVPFSDPMADGPTIQASSMRALKNGVSLDNVLEMAAKFRAKSDIPLVLFSYLNPLYRYGLDRLAKGAADAGIDGILVTDAVDDEAEEIERPLRAAKIDLISLVAPTTSDDRLKKITNRSSGFIYAVSRAGVTGARDTTSSDAERLVARTRQFTDLPIAVGFGISNREQVMDVWRFADAAVVGSAIVKVIEDSIGRSEPADSVREFVRGLLPTVANGIA